MRRLLLVGFVYCSLLFGCANPPGLTSDSATRTISSQQSHSLNNTLYYAISNFNWLSYDNKPFLLNNQVGGPYCHIYVTDINADGVQDIILVNVASPRAFPSCEVFTFDKEVVVSVGGFFGFLNEETITANGMFPIYKTKDGKTVISQWAKSSFGGSKKILFEINVNNLSYIPIAMEEGDYFEVSDPYPTTYYVYDDLMINGARSLFEGPIQAAIVSQENYDEKLQSYQKNLTWLRDVSYEYVMSYNLTDPQITNQMIADKIYALLINVE